MIPIKDDGNYYCNYCDEIVNVDIDYCEHCGKTIDWIEVEELEEE